MDIAIIDEASGAVVTVVDIAVLDGYDPGDGLIAVDATDAPAIPGGSWTETGGFSPPASPPLAEQIAARQVAVNARRDQVIAGGYQHNFGATAGIRTLDQRGEGDAINWLGLKNLADAAIAAGAGADPMEIRDAADETFLASATVVSSALVAMAQWRGAVMSRSWALKDAIAAAADETALDAIDIETGWPA